MSLIVDEHRLYLGDELRLDTFARAVAATVRPGDVVVDLGTGTGLLAFFACRAGARRVYAIELSGMVEIARELAAANGFGDRITFLHHHSQEVELPEPADVLVADLVGGMGFEAGLFPTYADARRFLKPGARTIPRMLTLAAAPVEVPGLFDEVQFWARGFAGLASEPVLKWARNTGYPRLLEPSAILSSESVSAVTDPIGGARLIRLQGTSTIERDGTLHGIGGWFDAELAPGVRLSNAPGATVRLNRRNVFLPLDAARPVTRGDRVDIHLRIRPFDKLVSWDVAVHSAGTVIRERHSTLDGMLLSREEMHSHTPGSMPRLTKRGEARRSVLELCDGRRTLAAIEREVQARHPDLFPVLGEAQAFVAEVVSRYSEPGA
jgi:protein arginine N-methyltransferase 1